VEKVFYLLASTEAGETESGGIFGALGIDWKVLILQTIAFGILVFILVKWVYPPILKMLDRRQKLIDDSVKAAKEATAQSEKAAADIAKQLKAARSEADDIIVAARNQSEQMLVTTDAEAQKRAEATIAAARSQLQRDVEAARKTLRDETAELVALATEKVVREKVDVARDGRLINQAISDTEKKGAK
jgi:F-type H+-transporting ATPase subunit b